MRLRGNNKRLDMLQDKSTVLLGLCAPLLSLAPSYNPDEGRYLPKPLAVLAKARNAVVQRWFKSKSKTNKETNRCKGKIGVKGRLVETYLIGVHLELSDHLDSDLTKLFGIVFRSVHVAESAIAHLFNQRVSLKAPISGHFCFVYALLSYYPLDHGGVKVGFAVFDSNSLVYCGGSRIVSLDLSSCLERLVVIGTGISYAELLMGGAILIVSLVMCVHTLYVRRRFGVWRVRDPGLLSMAEKVLKILYSAHGLAS